mgnify:CR=1 FL=1
MQIYIASPFFNSVEESFLAQVENVLRSRGFKIFSPREHEIRDKDDWDRKIFEMDKDALDESNILVACYHGNYSDSGTAWECGYAFARGIPVVAVHTGSDANVMIHVSAVANISLEELEEYDFENLPPRKFSGRSY